MVHTNLVCCWDRSGFKPCLSIYLLHQVYFCQLARKVVLSETVSSYFSLQKPLSVYVPCKGLFSAFWLESIPASYFMAGIWACSLYHLAQEGHVSSKYPLLSLVLFNTLSEATGWQHAASGNGQGPLMCSTGAGLWWGAGIWRLLCSAPRLPEKRLVWSQGHCCCAVVGLLWKIIFTLCVCGGERGSFFSPDVAICGQITQSRVFWQKKLLQNLT